MTANPEDASTRGRTVKAADRQARLEQELRANLVKRKGRMRVEKAQDGGDEMPAGARDGVDERNPESGEGSA